MIIVEGGCSFHQKKEGWKKELKKGSQGRVRKKGPSEKKTISV